MLQYHYKGADFSPDNQKKIQKKSQTCYFFLILIGYGMQNWQQNGEWTRTHVMLSLFIFLVNRCLFGGNKRHYFVHIVIFSFISQTIFYFDADYRIFIRLKE